MANIRVKPKQADIIVCPTPHTIANMGDICKLDARCTNAIAALLTTPLVAGDTKPISNIRIEKKRPNLCLRSVTNAINAAHVCTNTEEKKAHRNIWYHISRNVFKRFCDRKPITSAIVSNSSESYIWFKYKSTLYKLRGSRDFLRILLATCLLDIQIYYTLLITVKIFLAKFT